MSGETPIENVMSQMPDAVGDSVNAGDGGGMDILTCPLEDINWSVFASQFELPNVMSPLRPRFTQNFVLGRPM